MWTYKFDFYNNIFVRLDISIFHPPDWHELIYQFYPILLQKKTSIYFFCPKSIINITHFCFLLELKISFYLYKLFYECMTFKQINDLIIYALYLTLTRTIFFIKTVLKNLHCYDSCLWSFINLISVCSLFSY